MTNAEKFAEVFGYKTDKSCMSPMDFDCGDVNCEKCPYWKWLEKEYTGRRDLNGEAEFNSIIQSAGTK